MRIDVSSSFLAAVDIQGRLVPAISGGREAVGRAVLLARAARRLGVPTIAAEQYPKGLGPTVPELADALDAGPTVSKITFSAMGAPEFRERAARLDRPQAVICGMEAHICALQTALDLKDAGYDAFLVRDACGSRKAVDAETAFLRAAGCGIHVVTAEMVVYEWLEQAGTPAFKDILNWVK